MKKLLMLIFALMLVVGCSKAEPKQEDKPEVVTSTAMVGEEVVEEPQVKEEVLVVEEEEPQVEESIQEVALVAKPVYKKPAPRKKSTPKTITPVPEPAEEEIDTAIVQEVEEKVKVDEKTTKKVEEVETPVIPEEKVEEKGNSKGIIIALGAVAAAVAAFVVAKMKKSPKEKEEE